MEKGKGVIKVGLTGHAKCEFVRIISKKTFEKGAFPRTRWARKNQRASPIRARHHRGRDGIVLSVIVDFHIRINRTGPNSSLYYIITRSRIWDFPGLTATKAHIARPPLSSDYHSLRPRRTLPLFSFPVLFFFSFLSNSGVVFPSWHKQSVAQIVSMGALCCRPQVRSLPSLFVYPILNPPFLRSSTLTPMSTSSTSFS
jgi:hypothetical protein